MRFLLHKSLSYPLHLQKLNDLFWEKSNLMFHFMKSNILDMEYLQHASSTWHNFPSLIRFEKLVKTGTLRKHSGLGTNTVLPDGEISMLGTDKKR